jgi:hypothetical protein
VKTRIDDEKTRADNVKTIIYDEKTRTDIRPIRKNEEEK